MIVNQNEKTLEPKNQLTLYGYDKYFYSFKNLYKKNNLPNVILLSGPKGSGKSTFIYHFINYIFSKTEIKSESSRLKVVSFKFNLLAVSSANKFSLKVLFLNLRLKALMLCLLSIFFEIHANVEESTPPLKYKAMGTSLRKCISVDLVNLLIN